MGETPKVVIDTNIFVSGFGWEGKPKKILKLLEERKIKNFISPAIIEAVKRVISYKRLRFPDDLKAEIIEFIYFYSKVVKPEKKLEVIKEDPLTNFLNVP
ncbi:MAG: putative toxin-antitoxin system toxin component, PIN family [Thermodesulfobacteriota bacterium]